MVAGRSCSRLTTVASTVLNSRSFAALEFGLDGVLEHATEPASAVARTAAAMAALVTIFMSRVSLSLPAHPLDFRSRAVERLPGGFQELDRDDASLFEERSPQGGERFPELPEFLRDAPFRLARPACRLFHGSLLPSASGPARPLPIRAVGAQRHDDGPVLDHQVYALQQVDVRQ